MKMVDLANLTFFKALRRGLIYLMPFTLIGAFSLALYKLPLPAFQNLMAFIFGEVWISGDLLLLIHKATFQIMSLAAVITVSYAIGMEKGFVKSGEISIIFIIVTSFGSYLTFVGSSDTVVSSEMAGSPGMYKAIIIATLATNIFCYFYKYHIKYRLSIFKDYRDRPLLRSSFGVIFPAFLTIFCFCLARIGSNWLMYKLISKWNWPVFLGKERLIRGNIVMSAVLVLIVHILWFFGIHGGNVVMDGIFKANSSLTAGIGIFNKDFFDIFVYLGGAGATLGLLIALPLVGKNSSENRLAKVSILPSILNINETIIYGLPIIFNPYYLIPFIITPIVLSLVSWLAISLGLVSNIVNHVDWTSPVLISGYIGTGGFSGSILQAFNLVISILIYVPFVKLQMQDQEKDKISTYNRLFAEVNNKDGRKIQVLNRHDDVGILAYELLQDIKEGLDSQSPPFHLEYQAKTTYEGKIFGADALLSFDHTIYGKISPLLIVHLCEEGKITNQLGRWVLQQGLDNLHTWHDKGHKILLSINVSPIQLMSDDNLMETLKTSLAEKRIQPEYLILEITENATIDISDLTREKLREIRSFGINIAIDDFGMGHCSLQYIVDFYANIIKIDLSLISNIENNMQKQKIVKSIISLSEQLNILAIAEGVERDGQLELLRDYGCQYYQGFLFSDSLTHNKFMDLQGQRGTINQKPATVFADGT